AAMTRYARGGQANKKKPNEASSWAQMKADLLTAKSKSKSSPAAAGGRVITRLKNGHYVVRIGSYERVLRSEAELRQWKRAGSERRRQQRKRHREADRVCFHCRQPGHLVSDCPEVSGAASASGAAAICFRCGSSEHALSACPKMPRPGSSSDTSAGQQQQPDLPFASCFVCGRSGHLSRSCPDNPRGLYPKGGGCLLCSSVEHFKRDCPLMQRRRAAEVSAAEVALPLSSGGGGADDEVPLLPSILETRPDGDGAANQPKAKKKKVKVVVL
ncbi:hypothetical protein BOX15_Mlig003214g1, partial [Macrostomum lignano]